MKKFYTFGISTIILVISLLCVVAMSALILLSAYTDYHNVQEKGTQIQEYYQEP